MIATTVVELTEVRLKIFKIPMHQHLTRVAPTFSVLPANLMLTPLILARPPDFGQVPTIVSAYPAIPRAICPHMVLCASTTENPRIVACLK